MSTQIIDLNDANFERIIQTTDHLVWLDFWGENCRDCQTVSIWLERLPPRFAGRVTVGKINVDQCAEAIKHYGIMGIPSFLFLLNGEVKHRQTSEISEAGLHNLLDSLLAAAKN